MLLASELPWSPGCLLNRGSADRSRRHQPSLPSRLGSLAMLLAMRRVAAKLHALRTEIQKISPGGIRSFVTHQLAVSGTGLGTGFGGSPQSAVKRFGLNAGSKGALRELDLTCGESKSSTKMEAQIACDHFMAVLPRVVSGKLVACGRLVIACPVATTLGPNIYFIVAWSRCLPLALQLQRKPVTPLALSGRGNHRQWLADGLRTEAESPKP